MLGIMYGAQTVDLCHFLLNNVDRYTQPKECNNIFSNLNTNTRRAVYQFNVSIHHTSVQIREQMNSFSSFPLATVLYQ